MDDLEFQKRADAALEALSKKLAAASENAEFDADFNGGALQIEFDDPPAKFVISPNAPVRQIWLSAHSKSFKLGWEDSKQAFVLPETGETLTEVVQGAVGKQLGAAITL
ncbi:MAG TPA: iron donor protein CyaY [Bryobacteraceae bacterium]|jgi:CyaY protein|nr:iron donor protein CyaY [Bryobacteraceae bacterium]